MSYHHFIKLKGHGSWALLSTDILYGGYSVVPVESLVSLEVL